LGTASWEVIALDHIRTTTAVALSIKIGEEPAQVRLIARLGPNGGDEALKEPPVREFAITGTAMKGWVMVEPVGSEDDDQVEDWIG
jgi:hypothetical protein